MSWWRGWGDAEPPHETGAFGRWAEDRAVRHLRRNGIRILERNIRMPGGEIDLIGVERKSDLVCFVEVKARRRRSTSGRGPQKAPEWAVDDAKRHRIQRAAREYLHLHAAGDLRHRFDVVAIEVGAGPVELRWDRGAFGPEIGVPQESFPHA